MHLSSAWKTLKCSDKTFLELKMDWLVQEEKPRLLFLNWKVCILKKISYFIVVQNQIADPYKNILGSLVFWAAFHNILNYVFIKVELILTFFLAFWLFGIYFGHFWCFCVSVRLEAYKKTEFLLWSQTCEELGAK